MNKIKFFSIKVFLSFFLALVLVPNQSFAMTFFGGLSLADLVGTSSTSNDTNPPSMNILNLGASLGGRFHGFFLIGAHSSYSMINQTSEPAVLTGNRRGTRSAFLSPLIGLDFSFVRLQADYQMSGDYLLTNDDLSGTKISYKKPSGMGIELMLKVFPLMGLGIRYEQVDFAQEQIGSASATTLTNKLSLKSYGLMVNVYF